MDTKFIDFLLKCAGFVSSIQYVEKLSGVSYENTTTHFYNLERKMELQFAMGVACRQGTLTPPDTLSHPIWDLHMFYFFKPILFSELVIFPDYALRTPLSTFSILLPKKNKNRNWQTPAPFYKNAGSATGIFILLSDLWVLAPWIHPLSPCPPLPSVK